jgi:hypothetical protein
MAQTVAEKAKKPVGRPRIEDADYNAARARKMEADAQMAELELLQAKGKLVPAEDVAGAWVDVLAAMKARLLALPSVCAPVCATETELATVQSILENQVREALDELSSYKPHEHAGRTSVTDGGDNGGNADAKAAAAPKRGRVGRPRKATVIGS